ncbi:MAG: transglycosylase domain-containing protein [Candidatus Paceibacterales bacterium]
MPKRKYYRKTYKKRKAERGLGLVLKFLVFSFLFFIFGLLFLFIYYAKDLPRPEIFVERQLAQSTKIYDRSGQILLYEIYGEEKRTWVPLKVIPEYLQQAVIAAEDSTFYHHFGVDLKGIVRAVLVDLKVGRPVYGGSTIPQQLIRSTFLSIEKTAERKIREIILALELDRRYQKEQILEWYLNQVPFGQNAYGVEAASQTYFKKSVSEISLAEATVLSALIKAPYRLSPYGERKAELLARKDYILNQMVAEGFLVQEEAERAQREEIEFVGRPVQIKAPYFTLWVKQQLEEKYGQDFLRKRGLKVYTSLDWEIQKTAEKVVKEGIERNKIYNAYNAGLVAIDPKTGEVLAMTVGKGDYYAPPYPEGCAPGVNCLFDPKFNVVVGTERNPGRQPGSAFKPFVYATAFKKEYDDKHIVVDELTNFGVWGDKEYIPQNYDGLFRGPVTLRQALAQSLNVPSVKVLLDLAGLDDSIKTAEDLGITTLKPSYGPSIVLGGWEVKLLEMASAYGVFANDGLKVPPVAILRIEDSAGNILEENKKTPMRVLGSETARLINDVLSDNEARAPMFGSSSNLFLEDYQVAAKTGTTENYRDAWTIGYAPSIVVGIWVGNNNNESMSKKPGVTLAGPIFHNFMEIVLPKYPKENFPKPKKHDTNIPIDTNITNSP